MNPYEYHELTHILEENPYPGRGIALGCTPDGQQAIMAYFIMGRSENSRNRIFAKKEDDLFTQPFDLTKVQDPALIIYRALTHYKEHQILTNGDHTDTILQYLERGKSFHDALATRSFEPDSPNFTPRISGIISFDAENRFSYTMSILKSADNTGSACCREFFDYPSLAGRGHFLHTYDHNGDPLPPFTGEPKPIIIPQDIDGWADSLWTSLDAENKIALYVRYTNIQTGIYQDRLINKHN